MSEAPAASTPGPAGDAYRTNGFLFADLRDYTSFVESHGDEAAANLLARYRALVRAAVARHDGAEIRTEGDSFYVVFPSASAAVRCGLAIVDAARASAEGGVPMRIGIGIHAGETVETGEGFVGSAVNIAARICAQARSGEVLVSETVRSLTRTRLPVRFEARGRPRLKGITEPIAVFSVVAADRVATTSRQKSGRALAALLAAVAVVLAAVAVLAVTLAGRPGPSPAPRPPTTPASTIPGTAMQSEAPSSPADTPSQTFPGTPSQRNLLEQVPGALQRHCGPLGDRLPAAVVSLVCPLPFGEAADVLHYDRFAGTAELALAMNDVAQRHSLGQGGCEPESPEGRSRWGVGTRLSGERACFEFDGSAWIWWTYDRDLILARVRRTGNDWPGLLEWWRTYSILLRPAPPG